jgi:hypothetical protein
LNVTLPFYFYWADEDETTFNPSTMTVFDEEIMSFKVNHEEGQIPTLDITIRNPRIGLLAPGRKTRAWFAWDNNGTTVPLFFGVLVGIPTNLFKELVTVQFLARSATFIADKQAVAETMKVRPYYDPFFLDQKHRDEPDSILEGWSALWHIDRVTNEITASDVLVGEDGTVTFDEDHAFYDSVSMELGQPPLVNVRVEASVNWTQRTSGFFAVPTINMASYTGDSFMGDWPKPGSGIGGGYKVESSFVTDTFHVAQTPTMNFQSSWSNTDPNPGQCSNASASSQSSGPALLSPNPLSCVLTGYVKSGVCFPDSDPPVNTPAEVSVTGMIVPCWFVSGDMTIRYDANRAYSELLSFDMIANVQGILASPTVDQNTELISIQSIDLGKPMVDVLSWTDFASESVGIAQVIWPNNPTKPGGLAYQICVQAGTAGAAEPVFSDIPGEVTIDGSVHWASLGDAGLSDIPHWSPGMGAPVGMVVLITQQVFNINTGDLEDIPGGTSYYICLKGGYTNGVFDTFTYTPPVVSNEEPVPVPRTVSIINQPTYSTSVGQRITDGSVEWMVLGTSPAVFSIPIGGTPSDVKANNYFPTARGRWSVEYLIMKARARLRYRARAVTLGWDTPFEFVTTLSCRMNATLFDPRLPGGAATGKIVAYSMECDGSTGKLMGHVKVGVGVGFGDSVAEVTGTPEYALPGYAQLGWQRYDGQTVVPGSDDVSYTPPVFSPFDDGLHFPLSWTQVSDGGIFSNTLAAQKAAIEASFAVARELGFIQEWAGKTISGGTAPNTSQSGLDSNQAWKLEEQQLALASQNTPYVMEANAISWTCLIKPCSGNGPFEGSYAITVSPLVVPQGINLEAPSSP